MKLPEILPSNRSAMDSPRQSRSAMTMHWCIAPDVKLGDNVTLAKFVHLYGCEVGHNTKIGAFVEIQKNARIGKNCKISSHTFICEGVTIQDNVSVGHGVTFINDAYLLAPAPESQLQTGKVEPTVVEQGAIIGSGSTILSNLTIGANAKVGVGSVVTCNVLPNTFVAGNPAQALKGFDREPGLAVSIPAEILSDDLSAPHGELHEEFPSVVRAALAEITDGRTIQLKKLIQHEGMELERKIIAGALDANGWNRRLTARALSISYGALLQKIKRADLLPKGRRQTDAGVPPLNWPAVGTTIVGRRDADHLDSVSQR
jgi:acetyltransferase-like isoleucine patch superfamily enzyme